MVTDVLRCSEMEAPLSGRAGTQTALCRKLVRAFRAIAPPVLLLALAVGTGRDAGAQVPTCQSLTLYGNAANQRLCKSLSPTTQNLWVCALTDQGNPDVHTTFNAATNLHITVRNLPSPPGCEGNSFLAGSWPPNPPARLVIGAGQPNPVCNVNIQSYVDRLNAVVQMPAGGSTLCRAPFLAAMNSGIITQALGQTYLDTCTQLGCP